MPCFEGQQRTTAGRPTTRVMAVAVFQVPLGGNTPMSRITRILVVAVFCVALAVPALAQAKPLHRGFNQTFPVASRLCNHAANGKLPKALQSSSTQVLAACATLRTSFTNAQNTWSTTVGPLQQQGLAALKALRQTCKAAHQAHTPKVCRQARRAT